jgi:hypothetical protein
MNFYGSLRLHDLEILSKVLWAMQENPDMEKPFSDPLARLIYRATKSLCRYDRISLQLHETKRAHGGTKPSGSGTPAVANWK